MSDQLRASCWLRYYFRTAANVLQSTLELKDLLLMNDIVLPELLPKCLPPRPQIGRIASEEYFTALCQSCREAWMGGKYTCFIGVYI